MGYEPHVGDLVIHRGWGVYGVITDMSSVGATTVLKVLELNARMELRRGWWNIDNTCLVSSFAGTSDDDDG